ncbi:hypothetical protein Tco_1440858 [Tanacetum coccineum]
MTSSSNRRGAAKTTLPWTTAEEITLCTAWCNAMDTYVTRDIHSRKGFWEDVFANFKEDMGGTEEYQQLLVDEAVFKEHLEEEANAEQERAIANKELEEFLKAEQAHDELFMMKFGVKSDSEYETD